MLSKLYRLSKNFEFQNVYRKGKGASSQFFSVNYLLNKYTFPRYGVVVSKKTARRSVDRNKLKRQVREIVYVLSKKTNNHFDIVISARPSSFDLDFNRLKKELEEVLKKANLLT